MIDLLNGFADFDFVLLTHQQRKTSPGKIPYLCGNFRGGLEIDFSSSFLCGTEKFHED